MPTKIAMFGATGFTGRVVLERALEAGHQVVALVRDPAKLELRHDLLELVRGNALNAGDVLRVVEESDVVLHCLGVGGKGDGKPSTLVSDSVALVVDAMGKAGVRRLVCMSNLGAGGSGPWLVNRLVVPLFLRWLRPIIEDKDRMEAVLARSDVEWVAARFPNIVDGPSKPLHVDGDGQRTATMSITTSSVADYLIAQIDAAELAHRTPAVSN